MKAILAMQAGTIRLGNATLIAASDTLRNVLAAYGVVGAPAVLPAWGLENWRRYALFSADRAAALAMGDPVAVLAHLARAAGAAESAWGGIVRPDDLRVQGLEAVARRDGTGAGAMARSLALAMNRNDTAGLIRRVDLSDWFASGIPARILSGNITDPEETEVDASADPGVAYWGEFAPQDDSGEAPNAQGFGGIAAEAATQAFGELRDSAEKGLGTLFRAGGAFWSTLTENSGKK
jgi:hypothetical protein